MQSDDETLAEDLDAALVRAGYGQGSDPAGLLLRTLNGSDVRRRVVALRGASRQNLVSDELWAALLRDSERLVRREVARLLAYQTPLSDDLLEQLVSSLTDIDPLVAERAAFALGEHAYHAALEALIALARHHDDPRCRESAVAALGALGDDAGLATIIDALEDKAPIRRRAIVALSNFEGPDVDAALEHARDDRDWQVRAAVTQLGRHEND
ncbi:MAG: hypothetical protein B7X07_07380 [Actinobacteria bacterium 21-64-8]|nr:MAG: hypothetical protein B7X07_07380 [Actinobacteria bacterium 21-64-8]